MRVLIPLLALIALAAAACSHPPPPGAGPARAVLADCGGNPQSRPDVVVVTCSNGAITARDLRWSGWGATIATATGTAVVDICAYQDCHTGSYRAYPIVLVASQASACRGGLRGYTRIQYLFVGRSPFQGLPAVMKVPAQWWGQPGVGKPLIWRSCR